MKAAVAIYDCTGDDPQELTFKKGDIIVDVTDAYGEGEGWLRGRIDGTDTSGLFPENYVRILTEEYLVPTKAPTSGPALPYRAPTTAPLSSKQRSISDLPHTHATLTPTTEGFPRPLAVHDYRPVQKPPVTDPAATRQALLEKSNALAKTAREKATGSHMRETSVSAAGPTVTTPGAGPRRLTSGSSTNTVGSFGGDYFANGGSNSPPPGSSPHLPLPSPGLPSAALKKSASVSSTDSAFSAHAAAASRRAVSAAPDLPPSLPARPSLDGGPTPSGPAVPRRPPLLQSNQSFEPPPRPARTSTIDTSSSSPPASPASIRSTGVAAAIHRLSSASVGSQPPAAATAKPPPPRPGAKPADLKAPTTSPPPPPKPSHIRAGPKPVADATVPDVTRPLKPSEIRAQQAALAATTPTTTTTTASSLRPSPAPSVSSSRGASPNPPTVSASASPVPPRTPPRPDASPRPGAAEPVPAAWTVKPSDVFSPMGSKFGEKREEGVPPRPKSHANGFDRTAIPPDALRTYHAVFDAADSDRDGWVSADEVRKVWLRSGLDQECLARIWTLTDREERMALNRNEFA
ncbi:Vinexin [Phlyctochytrium bullatum]|nr:Vinexin [Phlyctochytrium bullatum]